MSASYPAASKSFTAINNGDVVTDGMFEEAYDEITAIEQALLTTGLAHHAIPDATANNRDLGTSAKKWRDVHLSRHAVVGGTVTERGRSAAMGEWTAVSHAGGDFTGEGSMTWTVESGDLRTFRYMLIGSTMWVTFDVTTSVIGGTPSAVVRIAIPGGFSVSATARYQSAVQVTDNGANVAGMAIVEGAVTTDHIRIFRMDEATLTAGAFAVRGTLAFEVEL